MFSFQGDGDVRPCFYEYYGTPGEVATSLLSGATVEPVVDNENKYCSFRFLKSTAISDSSLEDVCNSEEVIVHDRI